MTPVPVAARLPRLVLVLALLVGSGSAVGTAVLGLSGSVLAFGVGAVTAAVLAGAGGVVLVRRSLGPGGCVAFRAFIGAAGVVWGFGELLVGLVALSSPGAQQASTLGDVICTAAAPLALAGFLSLPHPAGPAGRSSRLVVDALVIAAGSSAVVWQTSFRGVAESGGAALAVAVLLADLALVALGLQVALAGLDRGIVLATGGFAVFALSDLVATHDLVEAGGSWPWLASAAACLAWPLACAGLLLAGGGQLGPAWLQRMGSEMRTSAATTVLVLALAGALTVSISRTGEGLDAIGVGLVVLLVTLFGVRELVLQRQRLALVRRLTDQAERDFLTGLGNRRAMTERLARLVRGRQPACVVVLDLDGFKEVNDRLGHTTGDRLLVAVAHALREALPPGWDCYRLGGDEFALVAAHDVDATVAGVAQLLVAVRRATASLDGVAQVVVSASAGVTALDTGGDADPLTALSEAATAMNEAKRAGRDRVVVHAGEVAAQARHRRLLSRRLREALAADALDVALQPIVDIATGRTIGLEALSRWNDPQLGPVPPEQFVSIAEQDGLVVQLGASVLRKGLCALRAGGAVERRVRMSVNASPLELRTPGYPEAVRAALREAGVPADLLVVEVTEAVYVTRDDPAVAALEALSADGIRIAVDDFGTGYSSLSYLGRLPVHLVKVDRSLTAGLGETRTRAVVEALVRMSRALDLEVIAEGVEERHQAQALSELGVRWGQGWLWSAAVPPSQLGALLESTAPAPRATTGQAAVPAPRSPQR